LTPAKIVEANKERAASSNNVKSENQQVANSIFPPKKEKSPPNSKAEGIKLKGELCLQQNVTLLKFLMKMYAML
jgi:hypothetical protein